MASGRKARVKTIFTRRSKSTHHEEDVEHGDVQQDVKTTVQDIHRDDGNGDFIDRADVIRRPDIKEKQMLMQGKTAYNSSTKQKFDAGYCTIFLHIFAFVVFFIDVGTDITLAVMYFKRDKLIYAWVTTGLIIGPSLINCCIGFHWYIIDYKSKSNMASRFIWFLRFVFTLLQIGPLMRIIDYLRYAYKTLRLKSSEDENENEQKKFYKRMIFEDVDICLLKMFESFLEAAPQLIWQLYILTVSKPSEDAFDAVFRYGSILSSWASLALSLTSLERIMRQSQEDRVNISFKRLPVYFIWRACEVGGRVICIAMFASAFKLWVFFPLLLHWVFTSFWLLIQHTEKFYANRYLDTAFKVICGYVMIFCFLDLREGISRYRFLLYYFITYFETFCMMLPWYICISDLKDWIHLTGFIMVIVLFVLHIIFQLLYYTKCHPTGNIKLSIPFDPILLL